MFVMVFLYLYIAHNETAQFRSFKHLRNRDSSVSIVTRLRVGRFPLRSGISLRHHVQTRSGAYSAYPMSTMSSFPGGKAIGPWSWPLASI